jgi:hypothetical protein
LGAPRQDAAMVSPQAQEIARLRAETRALRKKRYRGLISLALGAAGLAFALAGFPMAMSLALWALSAGAWFILRSV